MGPGVLREAMSDPGYALLDSPPWWGLEMALTEVGHRPTRTAIRLSLWREPGWQEEPAEKQTHLDVLLEY